MRIRIIQNVKQGEAFLMPGDYAEMDDEQALKLIEEGFAALPVDSEPKEPKKGKKGGE
jgi:hypothetical protein